MLAHAEGDIPPAVVPVPPGEPATLSSPLPGGWKLPLPLRAVLVEGSRSAEPPIRLPTLAAMALSTSPPALRVAIGLWSAP